MEGWVPTDGEIAEAVSEIMSRHRRIETQRELHTLVLDSLSQIREDVHVTAPRVRRVAVSSGAAAVELTYRDTGGMLPDICPVCKGGMKPINAVTLDGERVEIVRNCSVCSYSVSGRFRLPSRYVFVRPKSPPTDTEIRQAKLRRAAALLRSAKKLISEAVDGSGLELRSEFSEVYIDAIIGDRDEPGSLKNIEADLSADPGPLWARPLDSPKKARGKDI